MKELLIAFIAALCGGGVMGFLQFLIQRRDRRREKNSDQTKALRYIMLYIIQERAKELLSAGAATLEEKRSLRHWHQLYHDGLGGNGDADLLMGQVDKLPIQLD